VNSAFKVQATPKQARGWEARLDLAFEKHETRTVLAHRKHFGPLVVQKPFYPEGPVCHVYIIHPPGGVVGGDKLAIHVTSRENAHALVTTPAANKFYRSSGITAQLQQRLSVGANAVMEWLPQETILFDGSVVHSSTRIDLQTNSSFIGWEITCLGRPASGEKFAQGAFRQQYELWKQQQPLIIERALLEGGQPVLHSPWGLQSYTVTATLLIYPADNHLLVLARSAMTAHSEALCSATLVEDVLICRYLGHHAEQAKAVFTTLWSATRPAVLHRSACLPRIWNT
jgi:urease accessory protein